MTHNSRACLALLVLVALAVLVALVGCSQQQVPALIAVAEAAEPDAAPIEARRYRSILTANARLAFGTNAPIPLLAGQIHQESSWNAQSVSRVGAAGLCQAMPATARDFPDDEGRVEPFNPAWCLRLQSQYMARLYRSVSSYYQSDCPRLGAALASYNGGLGWHNKRRAIAADPADFWRSVRFVNPGISDGNQRENQEYPEIIVYKRQPLYRTWGQMTCLESR